MTTQHLEQPIHHLSLDFWDTLARSNPDFRQQRAALVLQLFPDFNGAAGPGEVAQAFSTVSRQYNSDAEQGLRYCAPLELIQEALLACGLNDEARARLVMEGIRAAFLEFPPRIPADMLRPVLQQLKSQGMSISITSNTGLVAGSIIREVLQAYQLLEFFDFQLFSDELGVAKPQAGIFREAFRQAQENNNRVLRPEHILHIGDNSFSDHYGARQAGWQAWLSAGPEALGQELSALSEHLAAHTV